MTTCIRFLIHNTLLWHHNGRGGISYHQPHDCLLNCLFRRRSKKEMASNAENVSIWWRHHETPLILPSWVNFGCHVVANLKMSSAKWQPFECHLFSSGLNMLTHWGRDKIDAILQTTFSNAISWMKMFEIWLRFHWSLFLRFELTIIQHWFR